MGGEHSETTVHTFWAGFAFMVAGTLYVLRSSYIGRHKQSRIYHYITALITLVASLAYLTMAIASMPGSPLGIEDVNVVQFCDWIIGTPLLLIDLGMLARLEIPEVFFICVLDLIMIVSGFVSYIGESDVGIWPLFVFSCIMQIAVLGTLVSHLYASGTSPDVHPVENRVYRFLAVWTIVIWTIFPIKFAIYVKGYMSHETDVIIGCFCDIAAKVIFGLILVGSREAMEGEQTPIALVSMAIVGLTADDVARFVAEYGEEHEVKKTPRRRSSAAITAAAAAAASAAAKAPHATVEVGSAATSTAPKDATVPNLALAAEPAAAQPAAAGANPKAAPQGDDSSTLGDWESGTIVTGRGGGGGGYVSDAVQAPPVVPPTPSSNRQRRLSNERSVRSFEPDAASAHQMSVGRGGGGMAGVPGTARSSAGAPPPASSRPPHVHEYSPPKSAAAGGGAQAQLIAQRQAALRLQQQQLALQAQALELEMQAQALEEQQPGVAPPFSTGRVSVPPPAAEDAFGFGEDAVSKGGSTARAHAQSHGRRGSQGSGSAGSALKSPTRTIGAAAAAAHQFLQQRGPMEDEIYGSGGSAPHQSPHGTAYFPSGGNESDVVGPGEVPAPVRTSRSSLVYPGTGRAGVSLFRTADM